ncbi:MAG: glycosyltransferase family 4 protein [Rhodocyclaceae bacterium]
MKIAVIRQRYNPYGGAERFVERALGALVHEGAEITLITRSWEGAEIRDGYKQLICNPKAKGRTARDRSFARCAQEAMASGGFDITQSHERIPGCMIFRAGDGVHAAWLAHLRRVRGPLGRLGLALNPYHRYILAAERAMFAHPALRAVICNSRMVRDEIVRHYGVPEEKLHVIYNGIDLARFNPALAGEHRRAVREGLGIAEEMPVFLFVGNGFERKGLPQLLRAFAGRQGPEARLLVVGADRKMREAQALAQGLGIAAHVHFLGAQQDVRPFYGAADAFALPTLYDPFPNAALEALACGLPLVSSSTCGVAELVEEGISGFIVDALDEKGIGTALDRLAVHAPAMRAAARAAAETLPIEAMSQRLMTLYRELCPSRDSRV